MAAHVLIAKTFQIMHSTSKELPAIGNVRLDSSKISHAKPSVSMSAQNVRNAGTDIGWKDAKEQGQATAGNATNIQQTDRKRQNANITMPCAETE